MVFDWKQAATGLAVSREPAKWIGVSKRNPCPVCERADWCGVTEDGSLVRCMRVESEKPVTGSDGSIGWIHKTGDDLPAPPPRRIYTPMPKQRLARFDEIHRRYQAATSGKALARLAGGLGVTIGSLKALGAAWAGCHKAWAFPMRDGNGEIVGVRLRSESGSKWAIPGSKPGLFYDPNRRMSDPVLICEGPTDTAALLDMGFFAVGRPNCSGGGPQLEELLAGHDVVIVSDRDSPHERPDGSIWFPGQEGAVNLARRLTHVCPSVKIIQPPNPYKDAREWVFSGATRNKFKLAIEIAYEW